MSRQQSAVGFQHSDTLIFLLRIIVKESAAVFDLWLKADG
jgi:hypothetical protein